MINTNDCIRFANVISKKYRFHYRDMDKIYQDFINSIVDYNATVKGPLFYSINNVPTDEILDTEFFMPVHEDGADIPDDMRFHSYFSIENMVSLCIWSSYENLTEAAYRALMDYIEENNLKQATPIFHVFSGDNTLPYVYIKLGVCHGCL